jgi:hypothetical protein
MKPTTIRERINPEVSKQKQREKQNQFTDSSVVSDDGQQRTRPIDEVFI